MRHQNPRGSLHSWASAAIREPEGHDSAIYRRAVEQYRKNPPKTLEEDLDYNFGGDDDSDEWIGLYENPDPSETNPS